MKKYYLFLIILFALKCSIIAQKVQPSRTYNLIEECYCTSFKQVGKLYNGTIVYVCTKCGKETMANPNGVGGTIEDIIEQNKREAKLAELMKNPSQASNAEAAKMLGTIVPSTITKQQEEAIKKIQKNQKLSNQKKPATASKSQSKTTSKSQSKTTSKSQSKTTSKPSTTTKKQQTNLDIPSVNRSSSKVAVEQPKPTVEENLGKISDGIDATIDMVKKLNNSGDNSCPPPESFKYNNPGSPNCPNPNYDPKKEWSGSLQDVLDVGADERKRNKMDINTHEGQNIGMAIPYTLDDMKREILNGNQRNFWLVLGDQFHQEDDINSFRKLEGRTSKVFIASGLGGSLGCAGGAAVGAAVGGGVPGAVVGCALGVLFKGPEGFSASTRIEGHQQISQYLDKYIEKGIKYAKFQNSTGEEVVYNLKTGTIDLKQTLGTYNKFPNPEGALFHGVVDVGGYNINQEWRGKNVKYAGITYSYNDDGSVSIIDAQTGKPMTGAEVERFATSRADTTPTGTVNLPPEVFSVEQSTTPYSNYGQQRKNNNSASSTPKNLVFGK